MKHSLQLFVSSLALWSVCHGYYNYQTLLPNGQHVPHPCKPNYIWHGVGHLSPLGGGATNQFGQDFARHGHEWTEALCRQDSDGDGLTNGQELGDPDCDWSPGDIPHRTDNITHPGVCDPWGSPQCAEKNVWVTCETGEFQCDAIHQPDVRNITLRFPRTKVPTDETTYICYVFDLPNDQPYHIIASQPYIDNPNVMHHIVAFGCDETAELMLEPQVCNMGALGCNTVVGVWTLGMTGECIHPAAGYRVGQGASTRVAFQFHWTNKYHVDHWYDSSGMTFHYTPHLRPNDAGVTTIGQMHLNIPPGMTSVTEVGGCPSRCTQHMASDAHVISALNHMHYLGVRGSLQQRRNGHVIANVTDDNPYSYDNPNVHEYPNPLIIRAGDELKMICEFSSLSRARTTLYGDGSYDEMCFGILTFYPADAFGRTGSCVQWKDLHFCPRGEFPCDLNHIFNSSHPDTARMIEEVLTHCGTHDTCRKECPAVLARLREDNPCLSGTHWEYIRASVMESLNDVTYMKFVAAVELCDRDSGPSAGTTPSTAASAGCPQNQAGTQEHQGDQESARPNAFTSFLDLVKSLGTKPLLQNIIFNAHGN